MPLRCRKATMLLLTVLVLAGCGGGDGGGGGSTIDEASLQSCFEKDGGTFRPAESSDLPSGSKQQAVLKQGGSRAYLAVPKLGESVTVVLYEDESTAKKAAADPVLSDAAYPFKEQNKNAFALASVYDDASSKTQALAKKCLE